MAGPLNGIGGQQIPLSNTFKPGQGDDQARVQDGRQQPGEARESRSSAPAGESRKADEGQDDLLEQRLAEALSAAQRGGSGEVRRGSVVDLTV